VFDNLTILADERSENDNDEQDAAGPFASP